VLVDNCTNSASDEEVTITRMLDKVLRRSDAIDKETLCIQAGQRVSTLINHYFQSERVFSLGLGSPTNNSLPC
jgi:hypothetical protein